MVEDLECADGDARRIGSISPGGGPPEGIIAATDAEMITLAKAVLTAGSYDSGITPTPTWAGYAVDELGNADTGSWMGWVNVASGDWVWSYALPGWIYLPEGNVGEGGAWSYVPNY